MFKVLASFAKDERGATAIEYALICGMIFLVIVSALYTYRDSMAAMYGRIGDTVGGATGG